MRNPLSTEALVAWLEKQPADQAYDYDNCQECLFGQYLAHIGFNVALGHVYISGTDAAGKRIVRTLPKGWHHIARAGRIEHIGRPPPPEWTFGKALERAKKLLVST